jgi:hypothetical protein
MLCQVFQTKRIRDVAAKIAGYCWSPLASKAEAEHSEGSVSVIASPYTLPCTAMGFMFTQ